MPTRSPLASLSRMTVFQNFGAKLQSIQGKLLLWFLVLGLLPATIVGSLAYRRSYDSLVMLTGQRLQGLAHETIDKIDRNLFERYGDVQAFAANPLALGNQHEVTEAANFYLPCYVIYDLAIVADAEGKIIACNTVNHEGKPLDTSKLIGRSVRGQAWFEEILTGKIAKGASYYSDPERDPLVEEVFGDQRVTLNFSAPITDASGKIVRVWSNRASWQRIVGDLMNTQRESLKNDGISAETQVLSKDGLILDDSHGPEAGLPACDFVCFMRGLGACFGSRSSSSVLLSASSTLQFPVFLPVKLPAVLTVAPLGAGPIVVFNLGYSRHGIRYSEVVQ